MEDIDTSSFAVLPWDEALIVWAGSYLAAFAARPNCIRLLATTPITDPSTLRMYDTVVAALIDAGWAEGEAVAVMRTVEAHVLGSALDVIAPSTLLAADTVPAELATLRRALSPAYASTSSAEAAFTVGISALVGGLRTLRSAETTPAH